MREVMNQGTTLVYVSHDLATVEATCSRGIWLREGTVAAEGDVESVLDAYRRSFDDVDEFPHPEVSLIRLLKAEAVGPTGDGIRSNGPLELRLVVDSDEVRKGQIHLGVTQSSPHPIFTLERATTLTRGENRIRCDVANLPLPHGTFTLWAGVTGKQRRDLLPWHRVASFQVTGPRLDPPPAGVVRAAPVHVEATGDDPTSGSSAR
jgi:hypothetical protein